jgi:proteasome accessory factor C
MLLLSVFMATYYTKCDERMPVSPGWTKYTYLNALIALLAGMRRDHHYSFAEIAQLLGCDERRARSLAAMLGEISVPSLTDRGEVILPLTCDEHGLTLGSSFTMGVDRPIRLDRMQTIATVLALRMMGVDWNDERMHALCDAVTIDAPIKHLSHIIDISPPAYANEVIETLAQGTLDGCCVEIVYQDTVRIIEPWVLLCEQNRYYEYAWCHLRKAARMFRLDRIQNATLLAHRPVDHPYVEKESSPATTTTLQAYPDLEVAPFCARLYFKDPDTFNPRDWTGARNIPTTRAGLTIELPYANPAWIAEQVVSHLGDVEVVQPPEIREAVIEYATRVRSVCGPGR